MYDYERLAYGSPPTEGLAQLLVAAQGLARVVDGFIMPAARCMEPVGVPHCRALDQKSGQELFTVRSGAHEVSWNDAPPTPPTNAVVKAAFLIGPEGFRDPPAARFKVLHLRGPMPINGVQDGDA
ncbi:hypothetical protein FB451DRAFT_1182496 [Mycena latifolia]|nr:hypothetical protein FB451DRAFT_1182496 [Mycena latifolia]